MRTATILLTITQLEDLLATAQAMQQASNRGHEWEHVTVFSKAAEEPDGGRFEGDIIYLMGPSLSAMPQVKLRIEHFPD